MDRGGAEPDIMTMQSLKTWLEKESAKIPSVHGISCMFDERPPWSAGLPNAYCGPGIVRPVNVTQHRISYGNLPDELEGFTIAHITDLHAGLFMGTAQIEEIVSTVNAGKPDLVAITGDLINHHPRYIPECMRALNRLKAGAGVYVVLGNHDYYTGYGLVLQAVKHSRMTILLDQAAASRKLPDSLHVIGLDDPVSHWTHRTPFPHLERLLQKCPPEGFRLLLSHRPGVFRQARHLNVHLTLSGHTHGGQMIFPIPGTRGLALSRMGLSFSHGWYHAPDNPENRLYVSRGVGTTVAPVRINCPPEIAWIRLEKRRVDRCA